MNNYKISLAAAVSLLIAFAPASLSQSMGEAFEPGDVGDMSWHPVSRYVSKIRDSVRAHWKPDNGEDSEAAIVSCVVNNDGSRDSVQLKTSSGDKKLDKEALEAVNGAETCGPVPAERRLPLKIEFRFKTRLPEILYSPHLDRDVSAVLYVPNDEKKIDEPADYPAKIVEFLSRRWDFKAPRTKPGDCFIVRCKLAADGTIETRKVLRSCSSPGVDAAAMKLLDEVKALPPMAAELPQSRFLYLGFEPVTHPIEDQIIAYKSETALEKRFESLVQRAVNAHWRPMDGKKLRGIVTLCLTINTDGTLKKIEWLNKSRDRDENQAAIRAVEEAMPIRPPGDSEKRVCVCFDARVDPSTLPVIERDVSTGGEHISTVYDEEQTKRNFERKQGNTLKNWGKNDMPTGDSVIAKQSRLLVPNR